MKNKMIPLLIALAIMITVAVAFGAVRIFWKHTPLTKLVVTVEATKSVLPEALTDGFNAVAGSADFLGRGDEIVVIPLTSDAVNEAQGRTVRHRFATRRKTFDRDLRETKAKIAADLDALRNEIVGRPFGRTDLLGTIRLVAEERPANPADRFVVVFLTDFIHDVPDLNFNADPAFGSSDSAAKFAVRLVAERTRTFAGARVFLGQMRSEDLKRMPSARRDAIRTFWLEFFMLSGAAEVVWATDGVGGLGEFLRSGNGGDGK